MDGGAIAKWCKQLSDVWSVSDQSSSDPLRLYLGADKLLNKICILKYESNYPCSFIILGEGVTLKNINGFV